MRYRTIPTNELSAEELEVWSRLQQADATTDSPFFRPEFSILTSAVRDGCEVAVMEQNDRPVGFLPFCRETSNLAYSVADTLTDFQGAIVSPTANWDVRRLVRECELRRLRAELLAGRLDVGRSFSFQISDPKPRTICAVWWKTFPTASTFPLMPSENRC